MRHLVVVQVDLLNAALDGARQDARQPEHGRVVVQAVDLRDVDQGGDGLCRGGRASHHMQPAGQQPRLDLHQPACRGPQHAHTSFLPPIQATSSSTACCLPGTCAEGMQNSLGVDLADDAVALGHGQVLGVVVGQHDVAVQVALLGRLDDGRADGRAAPALAQRLVAADQLLQLLAARREQQASAQSIVWGAHGRAEACRLQTSASGGHAARALRPL